jgi:hypothetical protein
MGRKSPRGDRGASQKEHEEAMSQLVALWAASAVGVGLFLAIGYYWARAQQEQVLASHLEHLQGELARERESQSVLESERQGMEQRVLYAEELVVSLKEGLAYSEAQCARLASESSSPVVGSEHLGTLEKEAAQARAAAAALQQQLVRVKGINASLAAEVQRLREGPPKSVTASRPPAPASRAPTSHAPTSQNASALAPGARRQSGMALRVREEDATLESNLQRHLSQLILREPDVTAVLSDPQGFALVGVGPQPAQDAVSAVTCLAHDLAQRVRDFTDLEAVELMELVDAKGRALRVRFFAYKDQSMALGSLGRRRLQSSDDEERMVSSVPELLYTAESA